MSYMLNEDDKDTQVHARAKQRGQKTFTLVEQDKVNATVHSTQKRRLGKNYMNQCYTYAERGKV